MESGQFTENSFWPKRNEPPFHLFDCFITQCSTIFVSGQSLLQHGTVNFTVVSPSLLHCRTVQYPQVFSSSSNIRQPWKQIAKCARFSSRLDYRCDTEQLPHLRARVRPWYKRICCSELDCVSWHALWRPRRHRLLQRVHQRNKMWKSWLCSGMVSMQGCFFLSVHKLFVETNRAS